MEGLREELRLRGGRLVSKVKKSEKVKSTSHLLIGEITIWLGERFDLIMFRNTKLYK